MNPCLNSGTCQLAANNESFTCDCSAGTTGDICEISSCDPADPCENNGTCVLSGKKQKNLVFNC